MDDRGLSMVASDMHVPVSCAMHVANSVCNSLITIGTACMKSVK